MAVSRYESNFMNYVFDIMQNGFYQKNERTGVATKRRSHMILGVDCAEECPILKSKKTFWKSSVEEAFWIFRDGSNNIHDLRPHIWDDWADENGIVAKTYGYQIKEYDQVNRVLNDLARDSSTRRAVIDLWNNADLPEMAITPCVYTSVWDIVDDQLNVLVTSRSCDLLVGGVFNVFQYTVLNKLFARHLGVKPGILTFVAADAHIYENQFDGCNQMLKQYQVLLAIGILTDELGRVPTNEEFINIVNERSSVELSDEEMKNPMNVINNARFKSIKGVIDTTLEVDPEFNFVEVYECEPSIRIDEGNTDFFKTVIEDIHVDNYKSMSKVDFPVAV